MKTTGAEHVSTMLNVITDLTANENLPYPQNRELKDNTAEFRRLADDTDICEADDRLLA